MTATSPGADDPGGAQAVVAGVRGALAVADASVHHQELDLALPEAPARLIKAAADAFGPRRWD
jgi:3-oxoacyl-[acyl-carrier protein] reductase